MKYRGTSHIDTQYLLKKIAEDNDKQAYEVFFNSYHARLIQFALLFTTNYQHAEDIVSEVFIRLLRRRKELHKIENIEGYLFYSVKNESLNSLKRSKQHLHIRIRDNEFDYLLSEYTDPVQVLIGNELRKLITVTVESLPPKRRMAYKLVKDEGMSYKQVGELLGISERTVETHLKLSVKELRETVSKYLKSNNDRENTSFMSIVKSIIFFF